jgi:hypothetical protein
MVLFFIYDEYTDKLDGDGARTCADMVMDALKNPHKERPQGESKLGEITRQYVYILYAYLSLPSLITMIDSGYALSVLQARQLSDDSSNHSPHMSTQ